MLSHECRLPLSSFSRDTALEGVPGSRFGPEDHLGQSTKARGGCERPQTLPRPLQPAPEHLCRLNSSDRSASGNPSEPKFKHFPRPKRGGGRGPAKNKSGDSPSRDSTRASPAGLTPTRQRTHSWALGTEDTRPGRVPGQSSPSPFRSRRPPPSGRLPSPSSRGARPGRLAPRWPRRGRAPRVRPAASRTAHRGERPHATCISGAPYSPSLLTTAAPLGLPSPSSCPRVAAPRVTGAAITPLRRGGRAAGRGRCGREPMHTRPPASSPRPRRAVTLWANRSWRAD